MKRLALGCLIVLGLAPGCSRKRSTDAVLATQPPAATVWSQGASARPAGRVVLDVVRDLDACTLGHRGVLLDFGDRSMRAALHSGSIVRADDDVVEHEGATWLRVRSRVLNAGFYWPAIATDHPDDSAYVEARVRGGMAHAVAVAIDGKPVGTWALSKTEARVVMARSSSPITLSPGAHELTLHFVGGPRTSDEPLAEVDWAHVGTGEPGEPYAAPTHSDAAIDAMVGGRSMRTVSLRAPGFVHCSGWIPANATLELSLATTGGGDADVESLLVRDRRAPVVLGTAHVDGGASEWALWSVPVTGLEGDGALASIELVVTRAGAGHARAPRQPLHRRRRSDSDGDASRGPQRRARRAREHVREGARTVGRTASRRRSSPASRPRGRCSTRTARRARCRTPSWHRC